MTQQYESALDRLLPDTVVELKCRRGHSERRISNADQEAARTLVTYYQPFLRDIAKKYGKPIPNMPKASEIETELSKVSMDNLPSGTVVRLNIYTEPRFHTLFAPGQVYITRTIKSSNHTCYFTDSGIVNKRLGLIDKRDIYLWEVVSLPT
jgi:hypothetical protein